MSQEGTTEISAREKKDIAENQGLSPISVYGIVHQDGMHDLRRPALSLWWSGVAAGLGITVSVTAEGILHGVFADHPYRTALENLGYTLGFVLVIMGRLQLFTESTLTAILPLLSQRRVAVLAATARLWGVTLIANFAGTFLAIALATWGGAVPPEHVEGMLAVSRHFGSYTAWEAFRYGIPAGFYIAAVVWMLPAARGAGVLIIILFTYLIAMGDFTHSIAGSAEVFLLMIHGELGLAAGAALLAGTLLGNIAGGTGLFALIAHGQVLRELPD